MKKLVLLKEKNNFKLFFEEKPKGLVFFFQGFFGFCRVGVRCFFLEKEKEKESRKVFFTYHYGIKSFFNVLTKAKEGVMSGFFTSLFLEGRGFKVDFVAEQRVLIFKLGFCHKICYFLPKEVFCKVINGVIFLYAINYYLLKNTTKELVYLRKADVYKGKGVRRPGVVLRKKQGKKR
jgi:ribosomal protein L6P/L9E